MNNTNSIKNNNNHSHLDMETQLLYAMRSLENNPDAVFWSDISGNICYVNRAACEKLGYSKEQLLNMNITDIDPNVNKEMLTIESEFTQSNISGNVSHFETVHQHRDGYLIPVDIAIMTLESEMLGCSFVRDISRRIKSENKLKQANFTLKMKNNELKKLYQDLSSRETQLAYLAYHDTLTGLLNRTSMLKRLEEIVKCGNSNEAMSAILFIDIDDFKKVNDTLGHSFGDKLLIEIGKRFSHNIRPDDIVCRLGGDEFIILMQDIDSIEGIDSYSNRIKKSLVCPIEIESVSIFLTCSIGVSIFPVDATLPEELMKYADTAMYHAKSIGKNTVQFFNRRMKEELLIKMDIEYKLRNALLDKEFALHYQPQYSLNNGNIRGIEALIRWNNPNIGDIGPDIFIPIAEETGLIIPIGEWVLQEACSAANRWKQSFGFDGIISVNISTLQLMHMTFVETVRKILEETELNPIQLELEITESMFVHSFKSAESKLNELMNLGVRISLDDFGKGYSSLGYLKQLSIDTLKIDKIFIDEIIQGSSEKKLINSIISLVQNFGTETIAEGIETIEQFEYLKGTGIHNVQGYLLSTPVPEELLIEIIKKYNQGIMFNGIF